jgi:amidophosphoribosyltransferase
MYPCYAGIDFPSREELLVYRVCREATALDEINQKIGRYIGVSFLGYNDIKGLSGGVGMPSCQMCLSCSTGDYSCLRRRPNIRKRIEMKDS